jgi:hypothetical protein
MNIRAVPDEFYWRCKAKAAELHMSLREFILSALESALEKRGTETTASKARLPGVK